METYLNAYLETGYFMGAVLVAHAGEILLSQGYGMANLEHEVPNTPQTKFRIGSVTKQFTATAILKLQEQGLLNVRDSISVYIPDYPKGERITVHQLLTHTSGIRNFTSLPDAEENQPLKVTLNKVISWFSNLSLVYTPGDRYQYTNSGYVLLAKIIEVVSGQSYADYLQKHILEPTQMLDSGYDQHELILPHRASGYVKNEIGYQHAPFCDMSQPSGAGAMYSTVVDLYQWDRSLYTDRVLNENSRNMMFSSTVRVGETEPKAYYGYGWSLSTNHGRDRQVHGGAINGFRAIISRYPAEQIVIIALSNVGQVYIEQIANDLAAILFNRSYIFPKLEQAFTEFDNN
jgi:CubicO group peptidase (beta-lactamase class C family)